MPAGSYYIEDVRWALHEDGEPVILATVDGAAVTIPMQQKEVMLDADIVLVWGKIDRVPIELNNKRFSKASGFVKSALLAIEVRALTRAYEEGKVTTNPRFVAGVING